MANITIPNSFTDGTLSDAALVTANYTAIVNGLTDATKTLDIGGTSTTGTLILAELHSSDWQDVTSTTDIIGWSAFTTKAVWTKTIGKTVYVVWDIVGTSNATITSIELAGATAGATRVSYIIREKLGTTTDNGTTQPSSGISIATGSRKINLFPTTIGSTWTASGSKVAKGLFTYETTAVTTTNRPFISVTNTFSPNTASSAPQINENFLDIANGLTNNVNKIKVNKITSDTLVDVADEIYTDPWTDYADSSTIVGFSSITDKFIHYKSVGNMVFLEWLLNGVSNATTMTFTIPFTSANSLDLRVMNCYAFDNSAEQAASAALLPKNDTVVQLFVDGSTAWTNSGTKSSAGHLFFEKQ